MKDEYGRINNKAQVIRELKGAELAYLLGDIAKNPHKYPNPDKPEKFFCISSTFQVQ